MLTAALALTTLSVQALDRPSITTGVWYEGGVGAFRQGLIPDDPARAAVQYLRDLRDIAAHAVEMVVVPNSSPEHHKAVLDAARRAHVQVILELGHEGGELGALIRGSGAIDTKAVTKSLEHSLRPIANHPALARVQLLDEPWPEIFDRYGKVADILNHFAGSKPPFCCVIESANADAFLTKSKSDVVAFDCYPLGVNTPVGEAKALGHFRDVAVEAANAATKHKAQAWAVLQCHAITNGLRYPTPPELRWMTNVSLGAGCKGIFWFLYQTEWLDAQHANRMDGLVDPEYRERPLWEEVGRLARRIRTIEKTMASLGPVTLGKDVQSTGTVFELTGPEKERYLYVINPSVFDSRTIELTFSGALAAGLDPVPLGPKLIHDKELWSTRLEPGEGVLLRVKPAKS